MKRSKLVKGEGTKRIKGGHKSGHLVATPSNVQSLAKK